MMFSAARFAVKMGDRLDLDALTAFLTRNGYARTETVMEPGEYAVRGGIVDIFPPGNDEPVRLDLLGDEVDGIRSFRSGEHTPELQSLMRITYAGFCLQTTCNTKQ